MAKKLKNNFKKTKKQFKKIKIVMSDFKTIFNGTYDAFFIHDIDGTLIDVNEKMLKMFGVDKKQALKLSIINDYSSPENPLDHLSALWEKVAAGEPQHFEWIAKRIDTGVFFPVEVHLDKVSFKKKDVILAAVRDITKKKQTDNALQVSERQYHTIFNSSADAFLIFNIAGEIKDANPAACTLYGYTYDEITKLSSKDIVHPDYFKIFKTFEKQLRESGKFYAESVDIHKNGSLINIEVHGTMFEFKSKPHLLAIVRDITKRKKMEQTLKENEEKYRSIYYDSRDAFTLLDPDGNFINANPSAVKLFGCLDEAEFTNRNIPDLSPEFQPDGTLSSIKAKEMINIAVKKGSHFFNWKHKRENGKEFYATVLFTRLQLNSKTVLQATVRDITEQKKIEEQLLQAQKMETVGTLAGGLAHDFNNVLAGIIGTLSLIKTRLKRNGSIATNKLEEYLDLMQEAGDKAAIMVKQLLTLSRKQELSLAPVDLNLTIKHVIDICKNSFDKSVKLNPVYLDSAAIVNADSTQIEQVLLNICVNSGHAMTIMRNKTEKWGGLLSVSIESIKADKYFSNIHSEARTGNYWLLSVKDNGVGMDKNTLDKIFNPFFSTKDKGAGTGLGLSMAYNIIKQHSGFIDVYSEIGISSTFNIYLPITKNKHIKNKKKEELVVPKGQGLILVVDDERIIRRMVEEILKECGYSVILAENGKIGLELFKKHYKKIKAVLLDMSMPEMSGEDAFIKMKEINPNIKVLLASGFKQDERVKKIISLGINGFIQKPYTLEKLAKIINKVINS